MVGPIGSGADRRASFPRSGRIHAIKKVNRTTWQATTLIYDQNVGIAFGNQSRNLALKGKTRSATKAKRFATRHFPKGTDLSLLDSQALARHFRSVVRNGHLASPELLANGVAIDAALAA